MPRRWNWDFEDEQRARRAPAPTAPAPPPLPESIPERPRASQLRRRRGGALLALFLIVAVAVVVVVLPSSHNGRASSSGAHAKAPVARTHPPSDPETDERTAVRNVLAYTPFVKEAGSRGHEVALTFDDGPGPYTPEVLSILERMHVRATFFAIGKMLRYFSASTVREVEDGDVIGDHTESHPMLAQLSAHDQYEELFEQIARVELLGGRRPVLFRPPYGSFNTTTIRELHSLHLLMVLWSVDTDDYQQPGVQVIVERALAGAHPGAIILMHDAGGTRTQTIAALPAIIDGLRARGFHLVTVPQLLMDDPPPAGLTLPPSLSGD
jgi:peptidoglycan/xylan/chitin deacetylase (PgdA/CDA1 family)